jgi:hypothetical protein
MNFLNDLSSMYKIDAKQPQATEDEINLLQRFSPIEVPQDYLEIVRQATEIEINVNNQKYIRIWKPTGCIEMNEDYHIQEYIPDSLAIGDDEGGSTLIYLNGTEGFGLYITGFGDLDADDAVKLAPNLRDLLVDNVGLDTLLNY